MATTNAVRHIYPNKDFDNENKSTLKQEGSNNVVNFRRAANDNFGQDESSFGQSVRRPVKNAQKMTTLAENVSPIRRVRERKNDFDDNNEPVDHQYGMSEPAENNVARNHRSNPANDNVAMGVVSKAKSSIKTAETIALAMSITGETIWIYPIQALFGLLVLAGFGGLSVVDTTWWGSLVNLLSFGYAEDFSMYFYLTGVIASMLCGVAVFFIATSSFAFGGIMAMKGYCLFIMGFIICLYWLPVSALFPLPWLWFISVVYANRH